MANPIQKVKDKLNQRKDTKRDNQKKQDQLIKWNTKLENAKATVDLVLMDKREYLYLGDRVADNNINSNQQSAKYANNIYNIIFEMIESQVNIQIPNPIVKAKMDGFQDQAQMIEDTLMNDLKEIGIEEINDINERITPMQGISLILTEWDPSIKHQLYKGDIKVSYKHPKQLIPQPGIYNLQKMDYFFVLSKVTKEYIKNRYNVDLVEGDTEEFPEVTSLYDITTDYYNSFNETVTEIVCWYKDENGDVGKYVWTNQTTLEDLPQYFYRRLNKEGKDVIQTEETLAQDTVISDGEKLPQGTKVPYYIPNKYPVSVRINVPKNFSFHGQSDIDIIRDQQDSIKKVGTKLEEKLVKSGSIITKLEDHLVKITDETYQIVKGSLPQLEALGVKDLKADTSQEMSYIEFERQVTQWMLGITDSYQGVQDNTAKSGRAKQIQVQQAQGRLQSKTFNKYKAFKELFHIIFQHRLAFADEQRPYLTQDQQGNDAYKQFDKYAFLTRDKAGELYYNDDFLFSADPGQGIPKDPMFLYDQVQQMLGEGVLNKVQFWTILEQLNFPKAKQFKEQAQTEMQNAAGAPKEKPPTVSINFKDMPPEAQQQVLQEIGIQINPQSLMQPQGQPPQQGTNPAAQLSPQHQQMLSQLPPEVQQQILSQAGGNQNG